MGWAGMKNGQLLAAASQQFTIFITADQKLRYQQNLTGNQLSIIVLSSNQIPMVMTSLPAIREIILTIQPGTLIELSMT